MVWFRALVVAGLSLVLPGVGHAVLRDWVRALLFAGLFLTTAAVFLPPDLVAGASLGEAATVLVEDAPAPAQFLLSFIALFCAVDAGFRAVGAVPGARADEPACPNCGRELDEDLSFCHWCTVRLEWTENREQERE